jgi:hypothetical protein
LIFPALRFGRKVFLVLLYPQSLEKVNEKNIQNACDWPKKYPLVGDYEENKLRIEM